MKYMTSRNSCSNLICSDKFHNQEKNRSFRAESARNNQSACMYILMWQSVIVEGVCVCHLSQCAHYQDRSVQSLLDQWFSPASISSSLCQSVWSPLGVVWVTPSFSAVPLQLSVFQIVNKKEKKGKEKKYNIRKIVLYAREICKTD